MKRRAFAAALVLLLFTVLALVGAYNLHLVFSGTPEGCTLSLAAAVAGLRIANVRRFFLLGTAGGALAVWVMLFGRSYIKYKSDMQEITPEIHTPKPEGQGQYGTACWLAADKISAAFDTVEIDDNSDLICRLVAQGQDDLNEGGGAHGKTV